MDRDLPAGAIVVLDFFAQCRHTEQWLAVAPRRDAQGAVQRAVEVGATAEHAASVGRTVCPEFDAEHGEAVRAVVRAFWQGIEFLFENGRGVGIRAKDGTSI